MNSIGANWLRLEKECVNCGRTRLPEDRYLETSMDGTGKDFTRVTTSITTKEGRDPIRLCTTDGRLMAFQIAQAADEVGVRYGIVLLHLGGK